VTMVLADAVQSAEDKLWILGAGWSQIQANTPAPQGLGIIVHVPYDMTSRAIKIDVRLLTDDGEQVKDDDSQNPIGAGAEFEVGRPPGMKPGERLNLPLALRFNGLAHDPGAYVWECKIDGERVGTWPFRAIE
jgi:uncharacterized protein DUF6941